MKTYNHPILTEKEEQILFLLIHNYSQQEIAQLLQYSICEVVEIIAESLCSKFRLPRFSTQLLINKAIAKGYAMIIPEKLLPPRLGIQR